MQVRNYTNDDRPALLDFVASWNAWGPGEIELGRGAFDGNLGLPGLEPEANCFLLEDAGALCSYSMVFPDLAIGLEVDGSNASAVGLYTSTSFKKWAERYWFELKSPGTSTPLR